MLLDEVLSRLPVEYTRKDIRFREIDNRQFILRVRNGRNKFEIVVKSDKRDLKKSSEFFATWRLSKNGWAVSSGGTLAYPAHAVKNFSDVLFVKDSLIPRLLKFDGEWNE